MRPTILIAAAGALCACGGGNQQQSTAPAQPPPQPVRVAAQSEDLRRMFTEIAAARLCDRLRGGLRPIGGHGEPVTGVTWLEECDAFGHDTTLTLQLAGKGWRWLGRESEKAGAEFKLDEYLRFTFAVEMKGQIDVAYEPAQHVFTLWFTPSGPPRTTFEPHGDVEVHNEGLWSDVVASVASAVGASPEERAQEKVHQQGRRSFEQKFAQGLAVTVDLCSGHARSGLGHPAAGEMVGASDPVHPQTAELHRDGLLFRGPLTMPPWWMNVRSQDEGVTSELVCQDDATRLVKAYLDGSPLPHVEPQQPGASCKLVHVLRAGPGMKDGATVTYDVTELVADLRPLATCNRK